MRGGEPPSCGCFFGRGMSNIKAILAYMAVISSAWGVAPVITKGTNTCHPDPGGTIPCVSPATTMTFTANQSVTWSLVAGSKGSINSSTGVYTAPSSTTAKNVFLGMQALPNDDIINTRIDNVPVDGTLNTYLQAQFPSGGIIQFEVSFPENRLKSTTPTRSLIFNYNPAQNGSYPVLGAGDIGVEAGLYTDFLQVDQHILGVTTDTGTFYEIYKLYPVGAGSVLVPPCLTCNAQSVAIFSDNYTPLVGLADAAGLPMSPISLRYSELRNCVDNAVPIKHALRFTLVGGYLASSNVWPATTFVNNPGMIPYGTRIRLKSTFAIGSFSAPAQCILTALKNYGMFMADGGSSFHIQTMADAGGDLDLANAFVEISNANATLNPSQFEVIDESSLEDTTVTSPAYHTRRVDPGNAYEVPDDFVTVQACNATPECSTMPVMLQPVTVGVSQSVGYSFMAGTPATQLDVWVNGSANTSFTCSMSPSVGTLTSGCLYTPPATSTTRQSTTITVTPAADTAQAITFKVFVYPQGGIRERLSNSSTADYGPDASGNTWFSETGSLWRLTNPPQANCDFTGVPWPGVTDAPLYQHCEYNTADMRFKFIVPNGTYQVTQLYGIGNNSTFPPNLWVEGIESQGSVYAGSSASNVAGNGPWSFLGIAAKQVDVCNITIACAGLTPGQVTYTATVSDNNLYIATRNIAVYGGTHSVNVLNAISVVPAGASGSGATLGGKLTVGGTTVGK